MHAPHCELAGLAADLLERVRRQAPRVHCITNTVAQEFTANVLLAAGAVPSMTTSADEIAAFVAGAGALLVNLGTFDAERRAASETGIAQAARTGIPWVLDPVLIDRSESRAVFARSLVAKRPRAIRLNAAEFAALAGYEAEGGRIARYAGENGVTVGLTGPIDLVSDGTRTASLANGDPRMAKITAMGCAASALVAACLAVEDDAWRATVSGLTFLGVAGDLAGADAQGPGTLAVSLLDALHRLDRETLLSRARIT
ncbi:MAG TPA: hydroxyethylthiazole kinase [Xanthobacteraceae bacterium]|jgi:hydroxyethylthiazole kinase|nr:hydroxyethylthiazole kinase [Xanthobacteraceae bacterium]